LTVANYYNFDGKSILEEGVTPTEVVRQASAAVDDGADDDADSGQAAQAPAEPGRFPRRTQSIKKPSRC
jgi:C-terminal processing protease CtpA/Prc